ncbi:hypothetical protein ACROYT_G030487 [Oculina patagonica]
MNSRFPQKKFKLSGTCRDHFPYKVKQFYQKPFNICSYEQTASDDPADLEALTPNHFLLQMKVSGLPPGLFVKEDHLGRKQWRKVQYLADVFWKRWINEYLPSLTERGKWLRDQRKVRVGDLVLVLEENVPRNKWTVGRVTEVFEGRDSKVRSAKVKTSSKELLRPIVKLCLLDGQE